LPNETPEEKLSIPAKPSPIDSKKEDEKHIPFDAEAEMVKEMPPQLKKFAMQMMRYSGPSYPPFMDKVNEEHISKALSIAEKQLEHEHKSNKSRRCYGLIYTIFLTVSFFVLLGILLYFNKDSLLGQIFTGLALIVGGLGGGGIYFAQKIVKKS
jgi:hypothetical protein